jgi:hypothetical protein
MVTAALAFSVYEDRKKKDKVHPVTWHEAQRGCRGIVLLFL